LIFQEKLSSLQETNLYEERKEDCLWNLNREKGNPSNIKGSLSNKKRQQILNLLSKYFNMQFLRNNKGEF